MALINRHNINNLGTTQKFVYVSGYNGGDVWMLLSSKDAMERFRHHEFDNDKLPKYCSDSDNIGVWVVPVTNGIYTHFIRPATGDIMKDFDSLIYSRSRTPRVKEIKINEYINSNETVKEFYKRNNYFKDRIKEAIKY